MKEVNQIRSIVKKNIVDEVYEQMKELIISGQWGLGNKIPSENELAQSFNVSRNTVRSAIQKLKAVDILTTKQGQGTYVCSSVMKNIIKNIIPIVFVSTEEIIQIEEFRKPLEMESVALAAIRRDEDDIINMQKAITKMLENIEDHQKFSAADYEFHLCIAKASKNKMFDRTIAGLKEVICASFEKMCEELGTELGMQEHIEIFEAIKRKEPEIARSIIEKNFEKSIVALSNH